MDCHQDCGCKIYYCVIKKGVRRSMLDNMIEFTEKVRDFQVCAEGQPKHH